MFIKKINLLLVAILMIGCTSKESIYDSKYFNNGVFQNPHGNFETTFLMNTH